MARQELFKEYFLLASVEAQIQTGDILENISYAAWEFGFENWLNKIYVRVRRIKVIT